MHVRTSDEFAKWFTALDQRTAEDVATTLEVIRQLGTAKEAPGSSEWLTWYEHPSVSSLVREISPSSIEPAVARFIDAWGAFNGYARRIIAQLESRAFAARVAQLDDRDGAAVTAAVARIKKAVTRRQLALSDFQIRRRLGTRPITQAERRELERFIDEEEIRDAYLAAVAAAGFAVTDVAAHSPALREIAVRVPSPGFRLLYGVDARRDRALVVLGEALDRSFYGDSVTRAERAWKAFLSGAARAPQPDKAR